MKTVVIVAVVVYGAAAWLCGVAVGVYIGWHKRGRADRWQLEDADKVISQAIEDRQFALNERAVYQAELLRIEFAHKFTADIDGEYRRLVEDS